MCVRLEQMKKKELIKLIKRMRKSHQKELKKYRPEPREWWIDENNARPGSTLKSTMAAGVKWVKVREVLE